MDVLTTILTCSLYLADDDLVRAIADSTPETNPAFVLDASVDVTQVDPPPPPTTADQALLRARDIVARGGRPLLGLLQVPPAWLSAFGRELADAFDPCTNIAVGTAMLAEFDRACGAGALVAHVSSHGPTPQMHGAAQERSAGRRRCVLRHYEDAIGLPDFAAVTTLELRVQRSALAAALDAPILVPPASASASGAPSSLLVRMNTVFDTVSFGSSSP